MASSSLPRVVLDTDTYNEVDDQFALAHLLLSPAQMNFEAVYAAPFFNDRSSGPKDGMEKSYDEIFRVLELVPTKNPPKVFRGSTSYLPGPRTPVQSDAVNDLIARAMSVPDGEKLTVLAIAAITNVASALLVKPKIAQKIVVVWLGGHAPYWPETNEFNLKQDMHGARVLLDTPVPLVLLPCLPVASHLIITVAELEKHLAPFSKLGTYLTDIVRGYANNVPGWSKVIWDISASAWMMNPDWLQAEEAPSPVLRDDCTWDPAPPPDRRTIRISRSMHRDPIFGDFYAKARGTAVA
jgi:purine nucleosidase